MEAVRHQFCRRRKNFTHSDIFPFGQMQFKGKWKIQPGFRERLAIWLGFLLRLVMSMFGAIGPSQTKKHSPTYFLEIKSRTVARYPAFRFKRYLSE